MTALVCCLLACAGLLLGGAAPAGAHAALLSSDPKSGAVVKAPPAQVSLTFSEQVSVEKDGLRVLDPGGRRVSTGKVGHVGSDTYRIRLRTDDMPHGTYTVAYQVISADSHPVAGAYTFSVGAPSGPGVALPTTAGSAGGGVVGGLYDTARYVSYAGFILLVGGAAFILVCWPRGAGVRPVQRLVVSGWVAMTAATLALLLMRGAYTGSGKVADIFDLGLISDVVHTKPGTALVSRLLLLAVAALFVAVLFGAYARRSDEQGDDQSNRDQGDAGKAGKDRGSEDSDVNEVNEVNEVSDVSDDEREGGAAGRAADLRFGLAIGGAVVAIGLAATWAVSEHASVGLQPRIAMPVDIVHLLAMAVWLGGLATLLTLLYRVSSVEAAAVRRFSALAFSSVVTLVATGVYQSWRQLGSWSALTGTGFGQLLLVKVGLVAVIVAMAASSRRWTALLTDTVAPSTVTAAAAAEAATETTAATEATAATEVTNATNATAEADATTAAPSTAPATTAAPAVVTPSRERAAQLARQQTAKDVALRKRRREADPERSGLRRSVLAEAAVAVVVLAVTTILTTTESGRTAEAARAGNAAGGAAVSQQQAPPVSLDLPYDTGGGTHGKGSVMLDLTPSHPGRNDLTIMVMDAGGQAVDIPEVTVRLTLPSQHIGPMRITPRHSGTGSWTARGVQIPMAGDWRFEVTVRTSDIDEVTVEKNAKIG
ncbi:copper resistance CopC/CopD family protein [Streptomyces odontomachi]|uniref:copper resistance CopC/CopD family protein n=1 Tax=Streptomyces odontomachi TaxID=2944940 RepID=UPI00210BEA7A|nr:copper resistance protein CopC [Streptomyces sp. ODS25]